MTGIFETWSVFQGIYKYISRDDLEIIFVWLLPLWIFLISLIWKWARLFYKRILKRIRTKVVLWFLSWFLKKVPYRLYNKNKHKVQSTSILSHIPDLTLNVYQWFAKWIIVRISVSSMAEGYYEYTKVPSTQTIKNAYNSVYILISQSNDILKQHRTGANSQAIEEEIRIWNEFVVPKWFVYVSSRSIWGRH